MSSIELFECVTLAEGGRRSAGQPRVDREKGIIFGVKVLGWKSLNGREYDPAGVDPALYEGRKVCVDHAKPGQSRSSRDTIGVLEGCRKEADGIYADRLRLFHATGEYEQRLMGAADVAPHAYGLSHTARGRDKPGTYGAKIEAVEKVNTVDVVDDPASVSSLYESRGFGMKKKLRELIESLKARRPDYSRALTEMAEAGIMSPDAPMDAPPDDAAAGPTDHKTALMDALKALCDEADTLDEGELLKKFKAILKLIKGDSGGGGGGDDSAGGGDDLPAEESRRLKAENGQLLAEKLIRKAAGTAKLSITEALVEALARPGMTEAQATAVVDELKPTGTGGQRPKSAAPVAPAKGGSQSGTVQESKLPDNATVKDVGRWLHGRG